MRMMEASILASKFRGALIGVLLGDCCGALYEGQVLDRGERLVLRQNLDKLEGEYFTGNWLTYILISYNAIE